MSPTDLSHTVGVGMKVPCIWLAAFVVPFLVSCSHTGGISKKTSSVKLAFNSPAERGAPSERPKNTAPDRPQDGVFHIIGKKESLEHICGVYGLNLDKVAATNKLKRPYKLNAGDTIFLPVEAMLDEDIEPEPPKVTSKTKRRKKIARTTRKGKRNTCILSAARNKAVPTLTFPVRKGVLSSPFGFRRGVFHKGLDIAAKTGTSILACAAGRVVFTGVCKKFPNYGKLVLLKHQNDVYTHYAHLSKISVKKGQKIRRGQKIGSVGNTGRSTGPHLHLEVRVGRKLYNPLAYFSKGELTRMRITKRFRNSPMGPVESRWRIHESGTRTARR